MLGRAPVAGDVVPRVGVVAGYSDGEPRSQFVGQATSDIQAIICAPQWSWPCWWANAVVGCESGFRPDALNPAGPYYGLFQIWGGHTEEGGLLAHLEPVELYDPAVNTSGAAIIYAAQGPGAWPVCGYVLP